ncbi:MAG TPA: universal stress protein [Longimicrobium sp.]|nr:universal stress protein [Longimicrobium sp.]
MTHRIRTIVAGVSHLSSDDPTLIAAGELARWTGAALHLVHAYDLPPAFGSPELGLMLPTWPREYAEGRRGLLEAAASGVPGGGAAVCHAVPGSPGTAIVEVVEEARADLVVVGAARAGRLATAFLGTTAQRVLRGSPVPVLVVRRPLHRPLERVLLTTDLSELSAAVHEEALDTVASLFGASKSARSLLVVALPAVPLPLSQDAVGRAAFAELGAFLAARRPRDAAVKPRVRMGGAAEAIAAEAGDWDADLLVLGTHARGWAARLALGSVAEAALRDAPCNVLAVPPRALALEAELERSKEDEAPAEEPAGPAAVSVPVLI